MLLHLDLHMDILYYYALTVHAVQCDSACSVLVYVQHKGIEYLSGDCSS